MSRIRRGYEACYRTRLRRIGARRLEQGIEWLVTKARRLSTREGIPLADALSHTYDELLASKHLARRDPAVAPVLFFCDAGLGGLARWLRAAGYDAAWQPHIADDELDQ